MKWSLRIARISDIDIKVHFSFLLILALGAFQWGVPYGTTGALFGVALMIALFTCVTLHELGHSIVAQRYGVPVREIVLLPLGGMAVLGKMPKKPIHELLIAAAGPLVNVAIAVVLIAISGLTIGVGSIDPRALFLGGQPSATTMLSWLILANVNLVLFNLIPAFPLDGGRILRSLLEMGLGARRATSIASGLGQSIAVGLGIWSIYSGNLILVLIAMFIFFGAGQENSSGQTTAVLESWRVGDAYNRQAQTLTPGDRVSNVVDLLLMSYQNDFAVLFGTSLVGVIRRADILKALQAGRHNDYVTTILNRNVPKAQIDQTLDEVRDLMAESEQNLVAVYDGERYLGLISMDDLAEAYTLLRFYRPEPRPASPIRPSGSGEGFERVA